MLIVCVRNELARACANVSKRATSAAVICDDGISGWNVASVAQRYVGSVGSNLALMSPSSPHTPPTVTAHTTSGVIDTFARSVVFRVVRSFTCAAIGVLDGMS